MRLLRGELGDGRRAFLHRRGTALAQLVFGAVDLLFGVIQLLLSVGELPFGRRDLVPGLVDLLVPLAAYRRLPGFWPVREQ